MRTTSIFDQLAELDFESWLDLEGVDYRKTTGKTGKELNIRECPTCGGSGWKVYFNPRSKVGVCFHGSHPQDKQFNVYRFISEHTQLKGRPLSEYLEDVMLELGWSPPHKEEIKSEVKLAEAIALPKCEKIPLGDGTIPKYLINRGYGRELCEYFDLRYSTTGTHVYWDADAGYAKTQDFAHRVIIPIYDLEGNLATYQGRDALGTAERKYLFPATLPASGKYLYNGHNAVGKATVIVGEGAFDVAGIKRALFKEPTLFPFVEPVGTFGMHLSGGTTEAQQDQIAAFLALKRKGLKSVVMLWDTETKTIKNLIAASEKLSSIGLKVRIAVLPNGEDPGEADAEHIISAYYRAAPFNKGLALMLTIKGYSVLLQR